MDNLIKLKDERIDELQSQLERKQARRKEVEAQQNTLSIPCDNIGTSPHASYECCLLPPARTSSLKTVASKLRFDESKTKIEETKIKIEDSKPNVIEPKISLKSMSKPSLTDVYDVSDPNLILKAAIDSDLKDINRSEVFEGIELIEEKIDGIPDYDEFKDSEQDCLTTIDETIQKEIKHLFNTNELTTDLVQDFDTNLVE